MGYRPGRLREAEDYRLEAVGEIRMRVKRGCGLEAMDYR